jgi:hypothetical protein
MMPSFSPTSLERLATCDQRLQDLFHEVIKTWDCTVLEGHRDEAAQEQAFKDGKSKLHYPDGKHNATPSMAVDVAPYPIDWNDAQRFIYFAGFVVGVARAMGFQVRWGGDWNGNRDPQDESFRDLPHFELLPD